MNGDLYLLLAGQASTSVPTPFANMPASETLRRAFMAAVDTSGSASATDKSLMLMSFGQDTAVYSVCSSLDPDTDFDLPDSLRALRRGVLALEAPLRPLMPRAMDALRESQKIGIPDSHCVLVYTYLSSDNPRDRVSGLAALLTLSAVVQYSIGYYSVLAHGGTP